MRRTTPSGPTLAFATCVALLAAACGGSGQGTPAVPAAPAAQASIADLAEVPVPVEVASGPERVVGEVAPNVIVRTAELEVHPDPDLARDAVFTALTVDGVLDVAPVRMLDATLVALDGDRGVRVAAVDHRAFRPFTPEVTAQTPAVWKRLASGEALVRHDVAHELGLQLGGDLLLLTEQGTVQLRIGAFASNGAPPVADVVVPWEVGAELGQDEASLLLVDVADDADAEDVGAVIVEALGGGRAVQREAPEEQEATLVAGTPVRIDPFSYTDFGDGTIRIDPKWVARWIVRVELPRVGRAYVNRVMAPQLLAAMQELEQRGLIDHLDPSQFAGGWVARHIDWNPRKPLSMHAWGLAVDFNSRDNALGARPRMDPAVVEVFERWGFSWGGRWARPDGMHFELARVVEPR